MNSLTLRKQYLSVSDTLDKIMSYVRDKLSALPKTDFNIILNKKSYESVKRKTITDKSRNILQLSDLVRGRVFFSTKYSFDQTIELIKNIFGNEIRTIDKKQRSDGKEYGLNYSGSAHIDLCIKGVNFELQVVPIEFKPYEEVLHSIYEKLRPGKKQVSKRHKEFLENVHNRLNDDLTEVSKKHRR